jgi:sensor c-di-GMP phosphodiesterase-like protein
MEVVAEGIETVDQLGQLKALSCDYGQGYLLSKPLTAETASALLQSSFAEVAHSCISGAALPPEEDDKNLTSTLSM